MVEVKKKNIMRFMNRCTAYMNAREESSCHNADNADHVFAQSDQSIFSLPQNLCSSFLTLSTLGKNFTKRHIDFFSYFSQKTMETICMKCQILFSGKNKKKEYHHFVVC